MATDLYALADSLGVRIIEGLDVPGVRGAYHHPTRTIALARGMTAREYSSVLAHELAHAVHGDMHSDCSSAVEAARDRQAARWLIDRADFARAARLYPYYADLIGAELGVTAELVHAYTSTPV